MKYVIFKEPGSLTTAAAIFPDTVAHSSMVPPGAVASSAGFWSLQGHLGEDCAPVIRVFGHSESLGLRPGAQDHSILQHLLAGRDAQVVFAHLTP